MLRRFILIISLMFTALTTTCEKKPNEPEIDNPFDKDNTNTSGDPFQLSAEISNGGITLAWNTPQIENPKNYQIYRSEVETTGYTLLQTISIDSNTYTDKDIENGHSYWYKISVVNQSGEESDYTNIAGVNIKTDPIIVINGGDEYTAIRQVSLTILASTAQQMLLSNTIDFSNSIWENYSSSKIWILSTGEGQKTVYLKIRYDNQQESNIFTASILPLDMNPAVEINNFTITQNIKIHLSAAGENLRIKVSEDSTFSSIEWQNYMDTLNFTLTFGDGLKIIYIRFINDFEIESSLLSYSITIDSTPPELVISVNPDSGITKETSFTFDARGSADNLTPSSDLQSRFDWENDGIYDRVWQKNLITSHIYIVGGGKKNIQIQLQDGAGWIVDTVVTVFVNSRPKASFMMIMDDFNYRLYHFDASISTDYEDNSNLQYRWDFDNDNIWDTNYSSIDTSSHLFTNDGIYQVRLEVIDSNNLPKDTLQSISVLQPILGFQFVEGGTYLMGDTWGNGDSDELPTHYVTLDNFYISNFEVTQKQWFEVMNTNPSIFIGDFRPVENVSWFDAIEFCNEISTLEGLTPCYTIDGINVTWNYSANGYRLPTEAEWEFAARGGKNSLNYRYSGSNNPDEVAWSYENSGGSTKAVGLKMPNELGLYDMSGNVYEWCWDWYQSYSSVSQSNPTGPSTGINRILRGGYWNHYASSVRVCHRNSADPPYQNYADGFRVVRNSPIDVTPTREIIISRGIVGSADKDLYFMDINTGDVRLLYNDSGSADLASMSHDQSIIIFSSDASTTGKYEIFKINSDGSGVQQITSNDDYYGDQGGKFYGSDKIWYRRALQAGVQEWFKMNYDGSGQVQITNWQSSGKQSGFFSFNYDQTKIVYEKGDPSQAWTHDIYTANIDLSNELRLTNDSNYSGLPCFSPNGNKIVWTQGNLYGTISDIFIMNSDGTNMQNLTNVADGSAQRAFFTSDGLKIIYTYYNGTQADIYIMNIDGSFKQNITNTLNIDEYACP